MGHPVGVLKCMGEGCEKSVPDHYWGKVKKGEGWFFSQDDKLIYCPDHLPEWVEEWRKKKALQHRQTFDPRRRG
jgi:hypothetical protein